MSDQQQIPPISNEESQRSKHKFKPIKRKQLRKRKISNDDTESDNEDDLIIKLEETRELQNLRRRQHGISINGLENGSKASGDDDACSDPFKVKSGGMVNMQALRCGKLKQVDDVYDTGIGTQFSVETNKRDEDEEMMKYIEEQLAKRKGNRADEIIEDEEELKKPKYLSPEEAALQAVPNHLRESSTRKNEEMLSNQMLSGIPEVDLGIEAKIKNIEATEEAKLKLLFEQNNNKDAPSQFVPTNMAVNFAHHSRFNVDFTDVPKKKKTDGKNEDKLKSKKIEKATDDYHYEKFKKQFRRY
ncbi:hypothetical protein RN001_002064 [Aquatica leii]|uniref:Telomere length and silencing protein 1 homolog n=1 Tax=Aquatica leii TaxID=1421715 RepID=A0AAN7SR40_9COLE|nr:hypothetical protein RN001_002064 [Aquatica leii]